MLPWSQDDRRLGVLATRLKIDGAPRDMTARGEGWREVESADWRWTSGCARLPAGARTVVLDVGGASVYWDTAQAAAAKLFGFGAAQASS